MFSFLKRKYSNLTGDEKFSEIFTGSIWALAARILTTVLAMVISIIAARYYGAEAVGILALVQSLLLLATIFTVLGTKTSILRLIPEHISRYSITSAFRVYRKTQYMVACVSLITGASIYLSSDFIAENIFNKPTMAGYFALASAFVVFKSIMDLNTQAVRGLRLIRIYAFMQLLPHLATLLCLIAITFFSRAQGNPVYALLAGWTITALIGALIMDRAFKTRMQPDGPVHSMTAGDILNLSLPMLMTASMQFFIGQTGVLLLGIFRSEAEVGYYSIDVKLATLTAFILQAINSMAAPKFSELFHNEKMAELFFVAKKSAKFIFWTTVPILLFLIVFGKFILRIFGDEFIIGYSAMSILILGQFINSIAGSTGSFMNMTGNQKVFRNIITIAGFLNLGIGLFLIPKFGINGAALAGMTSLIFWNIVTLVYINKKYKEQLGYLPFVKRFSGK